MDFIEWQTAAPINLTSFALRLQQDGAVTTRGAGTFKLLLIQPGVETRLRCKPEQSFRAAVTKDSCFQRRIALITSR